MATMTSVQLPDYVVRAAEVEARLKGFSLEDWLSRVVAERLDSEQSTLEFFRVRSHGGIGEQLRQALDAAPEVPPAPGDELPAGYIL